APAADRPRWIFAAVVCVAAAMATVLSVLPTAEAARIWAAWFHTAAASAAGGAIAWAALRRREPLERAFWVLLACGPLAWGAAYRLEDTVAAAVAESCGALAWVAALLLRPDQGPLRARPRTALAGSAAVLLLLVYVDAYLFLL